MNLARVIGTIWATRKHENLEGAKMQILQPIRPDRQALGSPIIAVDTVGAGPGEIVYYTTAREAVIAYGVPLTPIDAAIVGIVDRIDLSSAAPTSD